MIRKLLNQLLGFYVNQNHSIYLLLTLGLFFRFGLSFFGVHPDIISQASWGLWIYEHGAKSFYQNTHWIYEWPNQPPLVNLIYYYSLILHNQFMAVFSNFGLFVATYHLGAGHLLWYFNFVKFFGSAVYPPTNLLFGQIIIIKWVAILADLFLAFLLFRFFEISLSLKKSLLLTSIFLFSPFSWYLTSLWGQYDQISTFFFITSLLFLFKKRFIFSIIAIVLAFQIKPTVILFAPFYIYYFFHQKPNFKNLFLSVIIIILLNLLLILPFINLNNLNSDTTSIYLNNFFYRRNTTLVNHAFNFWAVLYPFGQTIKFTDLTYILGNSLTLLANVIAILIIRKSRDLKGLLIAAYILTAGSFIFGIGMLDRYFYPAILVLGLNIIFFPKLFWPWVFSGLLFFLNLLYSWGYPIWIWEDAWQNDWLIRTLSISQIILFFISLKTILNNQKFHLNFFDNSLIKIPTPKRKVRR